MGVILETNQLCKFYGTGGTADEKLDLCKEVNRCTLMKNGLER